MPLRSTTIRLGSLLRTVSRGALAAAAPFLVAMGTPAPAAPISAVAADGWQSTMVAVADLAFSPVLLTRQGYSSTAQPTTLQETFYTTARVALPWPNQATLTTDTVALSDFIYASDVASGLTNNSTKVSPKPIGQHAMADRSVVGNSLTIDIVAFHRNGIACCDGIATDGTNSATALSSTPIVLGGPGDQHAVIGYRLTFDLTALAPGPFTVRPRIYPRVGGVGSVQDSADNASLWDFCQRTFIKNTAVAAAPFVVYVSSTGNDTTGAVSSNPATAAASPCLTPTGAVNRARAVLGTATGALDGLEVRLTAGTWSFASSPTANTTNAEIIIRPAPGLTKADVTWNFGSVAAHANTTYVRYSDLNIVRTGVNPIHNRGGGGCVIDNCTLDNAGNTSATVAGAGGCLLTFINSTLNNMAGSATVASATQIIRMLRGCVFNANGTSTNIALEERCILGCSIRGAIGDNTAARTLTNCFVAFNRFRGGNSGTGMVHFSTPNPISNIAVIQNIFEFTSIANAVAISLSADGAPANVTHLCMWHNTLAGFNDWGRGNILYNETSGTARTHDLCSFGGNIHNQGNTKHDVFCGVNGFPDASTRTGGWSYLYGVGCRGEFFRYRDAGSGSFAQRFAGMGSVVGTSNTGAGLDPLFIAPAHTTAGPVAGAGMGNYRTQAGSPARALLANSLVPFDGDGVARSGTVAAGVYV